MEPTVHTVTIPVTFKILADDCEKAEHAAFDAAEAIELVDCIQSVEVRMDGSTLCQHDAVDSPESLLQAVQAAQEAFWNALKDLEAEFDGLELGGETDYAGYTIEMIREMAEAEA